MDLELLKKELNLFMKWIDRSSHEIPNEDWMNEQNVESYMDSLEFKTRVWAMPSDENSCLHKHGVNGWPLDDFPDNLPLYLDSGLFQLRSDDMEEVLLQQGVNESNLKFLERCKAYR